MQTPDNKNNSANYKRKSPWLWYLLAFALIAIFIGVFVTRFTSNSGVKYTQADLSGEVRRDENGNLVKDQNGNLIFDNAGALTKILASEEVTYLSYADHGEANYRQIAGNYRQYDENNRSRVVSFTATISLTNNPESNKALYNFDLIITNRTYTADSGQTLSYYNGDRLSIVDYTTQTNWSSILPSILLWGVVIALGIYLTYRLSRSISGAMGSMNSQQMSFNSSRARRQTHTNVKFKDVAGCDEVKAELVELVDYFHNGKNYTKLGAKLPKGFLLVGPPGTGKTLLAKAVAGEADVPFYSISGSDFVEMYVGVGAGRVRDMFKTAKQNAPCLIFIDEIDAVGRQRGAGMGGGNDEREQTLNQLLVEMDGFEDNSGVIVMAATNRADVLDPALTRAGRFDRQITVDLPDKDGREAILKVHARNKVIAKDVDFAAIASRTVGFSGADLANILNDAAILAVRSKKSAIDMDDIDEAIDRSIAGPAKTNRGMSEAERKRVAYHESGHAVIGIRLQHSEKVQRITIIPRGRTGGHVLMTPETDRFVLTKEELIAQITGLLGGRTSEEIFFGDISTGASNDIEQATRIARMMVTEYGMSELGPIQYEKNTGSVFLGRDYTSQQANYSTQVAFEIDKAVRTIINEAHENCRNILLQYKDDVELIAKTLLEKETITAEQIDYLLEHKTLPPKIEPKPIEGVKEKNSNSNTDSNSDASTNKEEENKSNLENKPDSLEETKKVETAKPNQELHLDEKGLSFQKGLKDLSLSTALIILFAEANSNDDKDARNITYRGAQKIVKESTYSFLTKSQAIGQAPSDKLTRPAVSIIASKELWSQFASTPEDFGNYIEQETGVDVIFVKVTSQSINKLTSYTYQDNLPTKEQTSKAKKVSDELKSALNQDEKDSKDKNKK